MVEKKFTIYKLISYVFLFIMFFLIVTPFILLFMSSIASESALLTEGFSFWPSEFSLESYRFILMSGDRITRAYAVSIFVTVIGTLLHVAICALLAYPLSLKKMPGRKIILFLVFFTMLFNGGLVPSFFLWNSMIGVTDSIWALILPNLLLSPMSVLLVRTYMANNIPDALLEAAQIDGAGQVTIFRTIVLPLSKPILITIGTFAGLGYWNDWLNGLYFIQQRTDLYNIQNILNRMVSDIQFLSTNTDMSFVAADLLANIPTTGIQMAIAFAAILPLLIVFPFLSKFYSKGIALGSVKE